MDLEIPVEFKGQQKWITGLSRGTTCDDVIYALLRRDLGPNQNIDVSSYRIYEEWKDCERTLSGRTKIMKLWRALGSEARNVRFAIRVAHTADILETGSEMSYGTRTRRAKRQSRTHSPVKHQNRLTALSKSEIYEQYYRKERRRRDIGHKSGLHDNTDELYSYMGLVSRQEQQLEQIVSQISTMEAHISQYESTQSHANSHEDYSLSTPSFFPAIKANDAEAYLHMCESLVELHENIEQMHSKSCYLASMLAQESSSQSTPEVPVTHQVRYSLGVLQDELDKCSAMSMTQQNELGFLDEALNECNKQINDKHDVIQDLISEIEQADKLQTDDHNVAKESYTPESNVYGISKHREVSNHRIVYSTLSEKSLSSVELNHIRANSTSDVSTFPLKPEIQTQSHYSSNPSLIDHLNKRNAATKELSERTKGVRFKLDVEKWMYDVLSEDDSQWENSGPDVLPNKQYSQNRDHNSTSAMYSSVSTIITKPIITSNNTHFAANKKNIFPTSCGVQESTMIPYTTYVRSAASTVFTHADDSNSDTGLSSMNSEEDVFPLPLETLV